MNVYSLFPVAVAKFELGRKFTAEELAFINWQPVHNNMGNVTSDERYILNNDVMAGLKEFVDQSVANYMGSIVCPKHPINVRITQSWLNFTKDGQFHHKHSHQNSYLSGVLYIKADKEKDKIHFYKDGYEQVKIYAEKYNLYNSDSWWLEAATGELLIFPSKLMHNVETVKGEERISLAFNTFPAGYLGEEETLTALHLLENQQGIPPLVTAQDRAKE